MKIFKKIDNTSKILLTICVTLSILTVIVITDKTLNKDVIVTSSSLSNEKIGWGLKNNINHMQPDIGTNNKKLIEKYNGMAIGNSEKKYVYLTFDLGYEAGYTANILDALKEYNVNATFFITAHYLNSAGDLVERMINEGHIVGNHTVNHKSMPSLTDSEINTELMILNQTLYEKFGYEMKYMRPPMGEFSERTLNIIESLGFKTVMWSFAYVDWNEDSQPTKEEAMNKIIANLHNGEIMLLHATSKTNSEIMPELLEKIKQEGYEIKGLEEFYQ